MLTVQRFHDYITVAIVALYQHMGAQCPACR
jgi:hypothetical protein